MKMNKGFLGALAACLLSAATPARPALTTVILGGASALIAAKVASWYAHRNDTADQIVVSSKEIATYSVQLSLYESKRKRLHGKPSAQKTITGNSGKEVITEAITWIMEERGNVMLLQPIITLTNQKIYRLRTIRLEEPSTQRLIKELTSVMLAPTPVELTPIQSAYSFLVSWPFTALLLVFFLFLLFAMIIAIICLEIYSQIKLERRCKK